MNSYGLTYFILHRKSYYDIYKDPPLPPISADNLLF